MISGFGWRGAYLAQGVFLAAIIIPLAALFRGEERPERRQVQPAGPAEPSGRDEATKRAPMLGSGAGTGWTLRQAMRTPHFWLLVLVYMFTGLGSFLVALHQLAFAVDIGFDKLYAAEVLGLGAFLSLPGVIITGTLSDYIGRELSAVVTYGTSIFGVICALLITSPDQHLLLWLHSCFFGLTWGARGPAITAKTADLFPGPNLGTILGMITIGTGVGAAAGSWMAGFVFDTTGSYRVAFWLSILFYACGSVAFWSLRRPPAIRP
jgi:MFS family permease